MAAALKPRLKALQACEPLSPLLSFLLLSSAAPSLCLCLFFFLFPPTFSIQDIEPFEQFGRMKANKCCQYGSEHFLFVCKSPKQRRGDGGPGEGWGGWQACGRLLISKCGLCSMFSATHPTRRRDKCVGLPGAGWCNKVARWLVFQTEKVKIGAKKNKKNPWTYSWRFYVWGVRTRKIE